MEKISSKRQRREFRKIAKFVFEDSGEVFYLNADGFIKSRQAGIGKCSKSKISSSIPDNQKMHHLPPCQMPSSSPTATAALSIDNKGEEVNKREEETNGPNFDFTITEESDLLLDLRTTEADFMNEGMVSESDYFTISDTCEVFNDLL